MAGMVCVRGCTFLYVRHLGRVTCRGWGLAWRWERPYKYSYTCCTYAHTFIAGRNLTYPYTADLLALEAYRSSHERHDLKLSLIHTPLNVHIWAQCLQAHPDQLLARYLLKGMTARFRIGYDWSKTGLQQLAISIRAPRGCTAKLGPGSSLRQTTGTISARRTLPTSTRQQVWRNSRSTVARSIHATILYVVY